MFETKMSNADKLDVSQSTKNIIDQLKDMERDWTLEQKQRLRKKIEAMVDKRARKSQYKDILLKRCKNHDGPTASSEDVRDLVSRIASEMMRN